MIQTLRLALIPCELELFDAILSDEAKLSSLLKIKLAADWLGFPAAQAAMRPAYEHLKSHPEILEWWTYLFIHKPDRTLIGLGGFKGPVNESGIVELGYAIAPAYRRQGLATEATRGMIAYAFSYPEIKAVEARTLPTENASTGVLEKAGMKLVDTVLDQQDGYVWRWRVTRKMTKVVTA
ncbi:MAG: GNAT family N-acetyltransferase [bacterium]